MSRDDVITWTAMLAAAAMAGGLYAKAYDPTRPHACRDFELSTISGDAVEVAELLAEKLFPTGNLPRAKS